MKGGLHCFIVNKLTSPDSHNIAPRVLLTSKKRVGCFSFSIKCVNFFQNNFTWFKLLLVLFFAAFVVKQQGLYVVFTLVLLHVIL